MEEGDGLLERRRSKEVAVVDDVAAWGRQLVAGGAMAWSERRLRSVDRGVVAKEQRRPWSKMATEKLMMENMCFASPGSAGKRDQSNRVGRTWRRQVAAVGRQRRREVVAVDEQLSPRARGQRPGGRLNCVWHWQVGPDLFLIFFKIFNTQTLKFEIVIFLMSKFIQILQVNCLKHKEQLLFLDQL
jgi:hypothetical protein